METPISDDRIAVNPAEAARITGISKRQIYRHTADGSLPSYKDGRRRLYAVEDLRRFVRSLPED